MSVATKSTFENVQFLYFYSFGAFRHFMTNLSAIITDIIGRFMFEQVFIKQFGLLEILLHKDFGVMIRTFASLLAVAIHIVPT
jgi:hypothetical protein